MPAKENPKIEAVLREYVTRPELAEDYDEYYDMTPLLEFDKRFLREELAACPLVLDVGCGTGRNLLSMTADGRRCVGMDLSAPMLDVARGKLSDAGMRALLVRADMRDPLPFQAETFDAVACMFSTIGLIPSREGRLAFVREVLRVLKPGGAFVIHVHNRFYSIVAGWDRLWLARTYTWNRVFSGLEVGDKILSSYRGIRHMYLHIFSLGEARELLEAGGFRIRRTVFLNDDRTGGLKGPFASVRANGFLFAAEKPG